MPVYDSSKFLSQSIESILNQTFSDFELLIFNDGSTDNSADIIYSYNDKRIKFFDNKLNFGHVHHLNYGIETAKGEYIARMDADDISFPTRLEKQVIFMDKNPKVGVCGTWFKVLGTKHIVRHPIDDTRIRIALLSDSVIGHPTAMIRSEILRNYNLSYNSSFVPAEDYLLWVTLSEFGKLANIPEVLLYYRSHKDQISIKHKLKQQEKAQLVRNKQIESLLNREISYAEAFLHAILFNENLDSDINQSLRIKLISWTQELVACNSVKKKYPNTEFSNYLTEKLNFTFRRLYISFLKENNFYTLKTLKNLWFSNHYLFSYFTYKQKLIYSLKCLLKYPV